MSAQNGKQDNESLAALQALLNIRDESNRKQHDQQVASPAAMMSPTAAAVAHHLQNPLKSLSGHGTSMPSLPYPTSAMPTGAQGHQGLSNLFSTVPLRAAAAFAQPADFAYHFHAANAFQNLHPGLGASAAAAVSQPSVLAGMLRAAPAPNTPPQLALSPGFTNGNRTGMTGMNLPPEEKKKKKVPTSASPTTDSKAMSHEESIRRDEIEAALRSKPQRGRKRDNLSDVERLELTRTRNREHAKSTRLRKKARYQELLESEQKLMELQNDEDLERDRRQSIVLFLSVRGEMIQSLFTADKSSKAISESRPQERETGNEGRSVDDIDKQRSSLEEIVESLEGFRFYFNPRQAFSLDPENSSSQEDPRSGFAVMQTFDRVMSSRIDGALGANAVSQLFYRIVGSVDGIAISKQNTGFVHVTLAKTSKDGQEMALASSVVNFQFAPSTCKLISVGWCTVCDCLGRPKDDSDAPSASSDSLGSQQVYPSVVSLDPCAEKADACGKRHPAEETHGPGMNI